ncbi:MAG: ABC transporter permease [Edaphobacter sp.]
MEPIFRDVRYALRQLWRSPGFTLTAVITLAFGIGVTSAIFSIVEGVLLRPLPFPEPDRLITLGDRLEGIEISAEFPYVTAPGARIYLRDTHAFTDLGAYQTSDYEFSTPNNGSVQNADRLNAARLTAGTFPTLGVSPILGRVFTQSEDDGSQQVLVLSYRTWRSRFHGDTGILGQKILLDRKPYEIIGVMPRGFEFPLVPGQLNRSEFWVPMSFTQAELVQGAGAWAYRLVGRLKAGMTAAQAEQDATGAAREIMNNFPPALSTRRIHPLARSLADDTVAEARPLIRTLFLAVIVVFFIACANLASLYLVRVIRRRREISVRLALGAGGQAILRSYLVEALLLSISGGVLGLALAAILLRLGVRLLPETLPRISSIALDWHVIWFALGLSVLTGLLCGLVPALSAARTGVSEALKEGGRSGSGGRVHAHLRSVLVVAELAVALVLLIASGLLLRSFEKMRSVNLGFRTDHVLTASFSLPLERYSTQAAIDAFHVNLQERLRQLPAVEAVGTTSMLPGSGVGGFATFTPEGYLPPKGAGISLAWVPEVMDDYFLAQGIPILRGRAFTAADREGAPLVAVVSRGLAEHYWPGQDPIGKRLHRGPKEAALPWITVVGEIEGVKQLADAPAEEQIYLPSSQTRADAGTFAAPNMLTGKFGSIVVRGQVPPEQMVDSLQAAVRSIDPQLPLTQIESMDQIVSEGQAPRRFNTALISAFAGAAVILALLGIYGVVAFSTAMRRQEIAIRLALGSRRSAIMGLVLVSGIRLGLAGCGVGLAAAFFATRLLRSLVFQVNVLDPAILIFATFAVLLITVLASVLPARRAASVEPMEAIRAD